VKHVLHSVADGNSPTKIISTPTFSKGFPATEAEYLDPVARARWERSLGLRRDYGNSDLVRYQNQYWPRIPSIDRSTPRPKNIERLFDTSAWAATDIEIANDLDDLSPEDLVPEDIDDFDRESHKRLRAERIFETNRWALTPDELAQELALDPRDPQYVAWSAKQDQNEEVEQLQHVARRHPDIYFGTLPPTFESWREALAHIDSLNWFRREAKENLAATLALLVDGCEFSDDEVASIVAIGELTSIVNVADYAYHGPCTRAALKVREICARAAHASGPSPASPQPRTATFESNGIRERAYAETALAGNCRELAGLGEGNRNATLNAIAYRLGRMVARKWLAESEIESALIDACAANGLLNDDGHKQCRDTIRSGLKGGKAAPYPDLPDDSSVPERLITLHNDGTHIPSASLSRADRKSSLVMVRASDVTPQKIEWLWPNRFAVGKFSIVAGNPGRGKSQLATYMAAAVTIGGPWPNGEGRAPLGSVIILSAEDDAADTLVPRLIAAGADLNRVHIVEGVKVPAGEKQFHLADDIEALCDSIDLIGDVKLVTIDPVTAYLGDDKKVDSHKNASVRSALAPLQSRAAKLGFAAVGVSHLNKGGGSEALMRVLGSLAFVAASRSAYLVVGEKDTDRSLFLGMKNNIGPPMSGLAFRMVTQLIPAGFEAPAIEWGDDEIDKTADEALAESVGHDDGGKDKGGSSVPEAMSFLRDVLIDGPVSAKEVQGQAKEAGISKSTLERAKKKLDVKAHHRGDGGTCGHGEWVWELPPQHLVKG